MDTDVLAWLFFVIGVFGMIFARLFGKEQGVEVWTKFGKVTFWLFFAIFLLSILLFSLSPAPTSPEP